MFDYSPLHGVRGRELTRPPRIGKQAGWGTFAVVFFALASPQLLIAMPRAAGRTQGKRPGTRETPACEPRNSAATETPTLDLASYVSEIDRWSGLAVALEHDPSEAASLRRSLPTAWKVEIKGQRFEVPTAWLSRTLESLEVNPRLAADYSRDIRTRLGGMRAGALALSDAAPPDKAAARQRLNAILAQREFRGVAGPSAWERLEERAGRWLLRFLGRLFSGADAHPALMRALFWTLSIGLVLLLLGVLARLVLGHSRASRSSLVVGSASGNPDWREWSRQAALAAARGNFREAIRQAYTSGLYRLQELGAWRVDEARTPREYSRMLGGPARQVFFGATVRFERAWYGSGPVSAEEFERVTAELEEAGWALRLNPATASS